MPPTASIAMQWHLIGHFARSTSTRGLQAPPIASVVLLAFTVVPQQLTADQLWLLTHSLVMQTSLLVPPSLDQSHSCSLRVRHPSWLFIIPNMNTVFQLYFNCLLKQPFPLLDLLLAV